MFFPREITMEKVFNGNLIEWFARNVFHDDSTEYKTGTYKMHDRPTSKLPLDVIRFQEYTDKVWAVINIIVRRYSVLYLQQITLRAKHWYLVKSKFSLEVVTLDVAVMKMVSFGAGL